MAEAQTAPSFVMHGAREVLDADAVHIGQQIVALEAAVDSNPGLAFDLAKTLLESACKTVLADRGFEFDGGWDLPKLLKETLNHLQLVPDGIDAERDVSERLRKTVGGLQTVIQGICELRNTHGFASHGKDAAFQQLETVQALLVARSADSIVNFLFRVHRGYPAGGSGQGLEYDDQTDFNEYVDEAHEVVRIFDLELRPSEVLYRVDEKAYRNYLSEYQAEPDQPEDANGNPQAAGATI